jgi:hypothetical protein
MLDRGLGPPGALDQFANFASGTQSLSAHGVAPPFVVRKKNPVALDQLQAQVL